MYLATKKTCISYLLVTTDSTVSFIKIFKSCTSQIPKDNVMIASNYQDNESFTKPLVQLILVSVVR